MNIREFLIESGNFPNLKGFNCLIMAVKIAKEKPNISMTRELYPLVAEKTGLTAQKVERAIRHIIERTDIAHFKKVGINKYPTNSELVFYFAEGGKR